MKITVGELKRMISETITSEGAKKKKAPSAKFETEPKQKDVKYEAPNTEENVVHLSVGDLAMVVKSAWKNPSENALKYIKILSKLENESDSYKGIPAKDIIKDALKSFSGWSGKIANAVKGELKARIKDPIV